MGITMVSQFWKRVIAIASAYAALCILIDLAAIIKHVGIPLGGLIVSYNLVFEPVGLAVILVWMLYQRQ